MIRNGKCERVLGSPAPRKIKLPVDIGEGERMLESPEGKVIVEPRVVGGNI